MDTDGQTPRYGLGSAIRDGRRFKRMVVVSVLTHLALFAAVVFVSLPSGRKVIEQRAIQTTLVRLGQDKPEWLPRKEQPPPPPKAEPVVITPTPAQPKPQDKTPPAPKKNTTEPSKFEQSLRRLENMEKSSDDYKGKGDPRGNKAGTVSDFTKQMVGMQWASDVHDRVWRNLTVPSVIAESERARLKTTVTLYVAPSGAVLKKALQSSSGNELFDKAVLRAIEASAPLPAPPAEIRGQLQSDGVDLEFLGGRS